MYFTYRKIVICTRPLFVPAVLVSILNLLSKIGLSECSKFNSIHTVWEPLLGEKKCSGMETITVLKIMHFLIEIHQN